MQVNLSNSQLNTFNTCKRRYYEEYVNRRQPIRFYQAIEIGKAFHSGVEKMVECKELEPAIKLARGRLWDVDKTTFGQPEYSMLEVDTIVLQGMLEAYYKKWFVSDMAKNVKYLQTEERYTLPIVDPDSGRASTKWRYTLISDAVIENSEGIWIIDYKTKSKLSSGYLDRLDIDNQGMSYIYFMEKVLGKKIEGMLYRIVKKPGIRQTKKESRNDYLQRLRGVYIERESEYLVERVVRRQQWKLDEFERELWDKTRDVGRCLSSGVFSKDTNACTGLGTCPYMKLCKKEIGAEHLFKQKEER